MARAALKVQYWIDRIDALELRERVLLLGDDTLPEAGTLVRHAEPEVGDLGQQLFPPGRDEVLRMGRALGGVHLHAVGAEFQGRIEGLPAGHLQLGNVSGGRTLPTFFARRSPFPSISHKIRRG